MNSDNNGLNGGEKESKNGAATLECQEKKGGARPQEKETEKRKADAQSQKKIGFFIEAFKWQKEAARVEDGWQMVKGKRAKKFEKKSFAVVLRLQTKGRPSSAPILRRVKGSL